MAEPLGEPNDAGWIDDPDTDRHKRGYEAIQRCLQELASIMGEATNAEMPMVTDWVLLTEWSTFNGYYLSRWAMPNVPTWRQRAMQQWDLDTRELE